MSNLHWLSFLSLCQRTPLYVAAREGCDSIVKYLVSRKASINIKAKNGVSVTNYFNTTDLSFNPKKLNPVFMINVPSCREKGPTHKRAPIPCFWPNFLYRIKVYLNERPPWSELCVEFKKYSLKCYVYLR